MSPKTESQRDRRRGALLGMAVGDALGTTFEFKQLEQPAYPTLATTPATDLVGGGPFRLDAGQITDDTQLAICLARSLTATRGTLDIEDAGKRYVAWMDHAFDIGGTTRAALSRIAEGMPASESGIAAWRNSGRRGAANGSLMRTAPIGVVYADRGLPALVDAALRDSMITHGDPKCSLACAAFDAAIAAAVEAPSAIDGAALIAAARAGLAAGAERLRALWSDSTEVALVDEALADCERDLEAATASDPAVYRMNLHVYDTMGFVRVAFRIAFWHAVHTPSWRDALVDVSSRGGDSDTNAAIAGALLGARDGASAIPSAWIDRVLAATQPGPLEWADAHHPRHLLALV